MCKVGERKVKREMKERSSHSPRPQVLVPLTNLFIIGELSCILMYENHDTQQENESS